MPPARPSLFYLHPYRAGNQMEITMRWSIPLMILPILAACSQQQSCISRETRDLRVVTSLVSQARTNIERGYALEEYTTFTESYERCGVNAEGGAVYCEQTVPETRTRPVAIDLDAERAKLATLQTKQTELAKRAEAAKAACAIAYPEE